MAKSPATATQAEAAITISELSGLDDVKDEAYIKTVLNNLGTIYASSKNDIISKLEASDSENTLMELRQQQITIVGGMFPEYANKTPIVRRATSKSLVCKDIYILGYCIVQKSVHEDLKHVYNNKTEPAEPQLRVEDFGETMRVLLELKQKIETLEKESTEHKKEIADLKSEINRVKSKCDQCNSAEDAQPTMPEILVDRPNTAQEVEIPERNEEVNNLITVNNTQPEDREPHVSDRPAIIPAPNMTDLFIGNVDASQSCAAIQRFMNTGTSLQVELKDIQEKTVRGDKKAFKVSVPHDKVQEAISIWPKGFTAERYIDPRIRIKLAKPSNTQARTNGTSRNNRNNNNNNGNNRQNNNSRNNRVNNRGSAQNRQNGNNQNQRRQQAFQDQVQNRHMPPSIDQYLQPRVNFQYPIPSTPPIPNQYWNQYQTPNWLPQPFFNL